MEPILEAPRLAAAAGVAAAYLGVCGAIARAQWLRRRAEQAAALRPGDGEAWLIAHASQSGTAEQIAWHSAKLLHGAGAAARVVALGKLTLAELRAARRALFVASTYGEGDAPDAAALFARREMLDPRIAGRSLDGLECAVLALGDRDYANYCGFGRRLHDWLMSHGAQPLFERIDVNQADPAAIESWRHAVGRAAGLADTPAWHEGQAYAPWRLAERRCLNPGSAGAPLWLVALEPPEGSAASWQAGDLAEVRVPGADDTRPREYSIASLPHDGRIELLVRRTPGGFASGWLCESAPLYARVPLRVREHRAFRIGDNAARPLLLVGNGSGLAGLRAHLKARARLARRERCWVVFGERAAAHDAYLQHELLAWRDAGVIARLDRVYSRDTPGRGYVQHRLAEQRALLRRYVDEGAAIYVCGSLEGMAAGVDATLRAQLGDGAVDALIEGGRYRRDVY